MTHILNQWQSFAKLNHLKGKLLGSDLEVLMFHRCADSAFCTLHSQFKWVVRQLAQQSLQNSVRSGQHRGGLPFSWGRGRQAMHLPCKQVDVGALPTDSTISLRGE